MSYATRHKRKGKMPPRHRKAISEGLLEYHRGHKHKKRKRKSPYSEGYYGSFPSNTFFSSGWGHGFSHAGRMGGGKMGGGARGSNRR